MASQGASAVLAVDGRNENFDLEELLDDGGSLVGSGVINMSKGQRIVLSPNAVYEFEGVRRTPLFGEAHLNGNRSISRRLGNGLSMIGRRFLTGESMILDVYEAERDGATLSISSDAVGSELKTIDTNGRTIVARAGVYFGSEPGVSFRVESPLRDLRIGVRERAMLSAYGPGPLLQKFEGIPGRKDTKMIMNFEGDWKSRILGEGEAIEQIDPRHLYAWEDTVKLSLVPVGKMIDLLLRGEIRYYVRAEGPGEVWSSNVGYSNGYWGNILTPTHWIYRTTSFVPRLLGWSR